MAWLRLERSGIFQDPGTYQNRPQYDGIAEQTTDLPTGSAKASFNGSSIDLAPGSIAYITADDSVRVRLSDGSWKEVGT